MSIQDLRIERQDLCAKARALIDANPGASFSAKVQSKVDDIYARIDAIDREMDALEKIKAWGPQASDGSSPGEWIDTATGRPIPMAHASDDFRAKFAGAFKDSATMQGTEKATLGEYFKAVAGMKVAPSIRAALSEGTDGNGGYLLPSYLQVGLLEALVQNSALLQSGVGVAVLDAGAKNYRVAKIATVPVAGWRSEAGTLATSAPTFDAVTLTPQSLAFTFKCSRELIQDAPNLEPALMIAIGQAFAKALDAAGLHGSGTPPEIRGIANTSNVNAITNGGAGTALGTIKFSNLISAVNAILAADGPMPTSAIMAPRTLTGLASLADSTGQPLRAPALLDGIKFIPSSQVSITDTVGASTDCSTMLIGDFKAGASWFIREGISVQRLSELYAASGEIGFACHVRADLGVLRPTVFANCSGIRP